MSRSQAGSGWLVAGACSRPPGRDSVCGKLAGSRGESVCFLAADKDKNNCNEGRLWQRV